MRWAEASLVRRVGLTAAGTALVAAAATLGAALLITERDLLDDAERDAASRARAVADEIDADVVEGGDLKALTADAQEFTFGGVAVAVDFAGKQVAGSSALPARRDAGCGYVVSGAGPWLVCARTSARGYHVRVGRRRDEILAHRESLLEEGLLVALVVVMASVFAGVVVARGSLAPLSRLRAALEELEVGAPTRSPDLPQSGFVEIDLVTATLDRVLGRLTREVMRSQEFAADAAHELRSPLTKLRTELELLLEDAPRGSNASRRLERLVTRTEDLSTLVERLLVLGSPQEALRGNSLVSLAATAEAVTEELGNDARVRVRLHCTDDGVVRGEASMLAAVISNAVGNALKFSKGPVDVHVDRESARVVLRVDDEGPGIDAAERTQVFRHFVRGPRSQAVAGHGVGLALVAHIIDAHQGQVAFVDGPPGAHLRIELPAYESEKAGAGAEAAPHDAPAANRS